MGKIIDTDNVIRHFESIIESTDKVKKMNKGFIMGLEFAISCLETEPPAQSCEFWDSESNFCALNRPFAQPKRKNGKWINGFCSCCGSHAPYWPMSSTYYESEFCPSCGQDMRGEQDER